MTKKQVINLSNFKPIDIPPEIQKCPYCDQALYISEINEYSYEDDGSDIWPENFALECVSEPDMEEDEWDDWLDQHSRMPYVYWMPAEEKVKKWLTENYTFVETTK